MGEFDDLDLKLGRAGGDASLDCIPRSRYRTLGDSERRTGYDLWHAYEAGYLLPSGRPVVGLLRIRIDADSPAIVESKSLKLYLNARVREVFADEAAFKARVTADLMACVGATVDLEWMTPRLGPRRSDMTGICLDGLEPKAGEVGLRAIDRGGCFTYFSHLFQSNCPVTGQPDWASVWIQWEGSRGVSAQSLFGYLIGFANKRAFHESCCETIYRDLERSLKPDSLTVACHFLRRGGIDINPVRQSEGAPEYAFHLTHRQ